MKVFLTSLAATSTILLILDVLWLGLVAPAFYRSQIGHLLKPSFSLAPAIAFYVVYALAITFLVVVPALRAGSLTQALITGAVFGFAAYATYDLTNHATLRDWPLIVTLVDLAWGTFLTTVVAGGATYLVQRFMSL